LITSQQKLINQLYDTNIAIGESIPGIQAEYNLMVDQMARLNMPSSQVVIAKNQVFIAERILRSISSVLVGTENARASADDFSADIETFGAYLNAQLNGSADLGVERISDPSLRESVDSIKSEYDEVLKQQHQRYLKMPTRL
jgi:twitching motility protein PilJ